MKEITIESLAYLLKQAKENKQPQPIIFLGAGASHTGNIPLASEITAQILSDFSESPFINRLPIESRNYANLMDCLLPAQRDILLKKYVDDAKINVTHIYLAQLLKEGFIDYILTVNFDNLILRALALYNIFPASYDMAILKDLTTTTFKEKSVVYLHGQNHGLWLLNTPEEMEKVRTIVPRIFDSIKNRRPWIFIGYSGEDPIFEHIKKLGRFDNGLFWVTYIDNNPNETVQNFLCTPNTNAFLIKGYDSDSFMLKLNSELGLGQPSIVDKPFTALKEMLNEIVDINDKEYFKGVKERLEISKKQVEEAIQQHELGILELPKDLKENSELDLLKKEIINIIISEKYDEQIISDIENKITANLDDENLLYILSNLYFSWGTALGNSAANKEREDEEEAEKYYLQCFEKLRKSIDLTPESNTFYNWGTYLGKLAKIKGEKREIAEAEKLYVESIEKFSKAIEKNPIDPEVFYNWGTSLGNLARFKTEKEAEKNYLKSFEKFRKSIEIKSDYYQAFFNWGVNLGNLAEIKKKNGLKVAEEFYNQAFEKYREAVRIKPDYDIAYYSWATDIGKLEMIKDGEEAAKLYSEAVELFKKGIEYRGRCYNLACLYALHENKKDALFYLDLSLKNNEISASYVEKDDDWKNFQTDFDFNEILKKYIK
jgi:tetratricopeptide (TPR) repeat protein